ncbi:FadR/GntR family transcriptional regulator [Lichenifustis flavocetrariae]|uniref:FadR family transcriptional regulator n=1 Tax=Lichenifustis flavocetrariae TaxID=2949735 RepID=A0AA41Z0X7_9HYPH|nr:FadR/GntR family transcriptional regulator [Lichenifustis flavocetrariae]MCW6510783.1 FadR family transcriptional regulator [Lichenifustis flavocetrariae]
MIDPQSADPRAASLVDRLMADVCDHIRVNGLEPGAVLPSEADFASRAGVSRAVAREGFRGLAALKLIDVGNGRRARVAQTDDSVLSLMIDHAVHTKQIRIQQILDVRRTIELRTVALAALRRSDREATDIVDLAATMRANLAQPEKVMDADIAFHEAIAKASRNPMFALLVGSFRVVTRETWPIGWATRFNQASQVENIDCHDSIARAIRDRDMRAAESAMAHHFDSAIKTLVDAGVI